MESNFKLIEKIAPITGEGKNGQWKKQNLIFETEGQYPKKVCVSVWGDKINTEDLKVGESYDVGFDVESREYNGNWYTDVRAWKINPAGGNPYAQQNDSSSKTAPAKATFTATEEEDDLPF